jgi:hypothetical protein
MADEIISGSGLAVALGAKLIYDVCGPTAKYVGGELASYSKTGTKNLKRVFENAARQINAQSKTNGQVPPRVLKEILFEGYFCEDELQALYLGGMLASSKGPVSRDDRAVAYCSLVSSLSTYQIRTHGILYSTILRATHFHVGEKPFLIKDLLGTIQKQSLTVAIRETDYRKAMDFSDAENPESIAQHSFVGLEMKGLSERGTQICYPRDRKGNPKTGEVPFRFIYPTILGVELFLWGIGFGDCGLDRYKPDLLQKIKLPFSVEPYEVHPGKVNFA